jgi:ABC-type lipoprotein export system ATPase subunit
MHIERVQIEEGFLDGLDVSFAPGLNVIIGARGTGKTSLIELIKFCLDVKGHTPETSRRRFDHALSVLGSGQVTVTIADGSRRVLVTRTANDTIPRATEPYVAPLVFSQTEIESVGLQSSGRLGLLSGFSDVSADSAAEGDAAAEARSLTAQAATLRRELEELQRRAAEIPVIDAELAKLAPSELQLSTFSAEAAKRKAELDALTTDISSKSVAEAVVARLKQKMDGWRSAIAAAARTPPLEEHWPEAPEQGNPLAPIHARFAKVQGYLKVALEELALADGEVSSIAGSRNSGRLASEEKARHLRKDLETLQAGAGNIARQGQQLRQSKAQLEALRALLTQRTADLTTLVSSRGKVLDRLEELRDARFTSRARVANDLNKVLGPRIRISVSRAGQHEPFGAAIADALKGSGLKYGDLAQALAKKVSPRELLEAAEADDIAFITEAAGITPDRTERLLAHLREADLGAVGTASVADLVDFQLLDGTDYKDISELSTGQRCTVVLPIVLQHTDRMLIVDQPEDHIDNAFIADTLIRSVLARDPTSQIIFSSHNANIPVLGNADKVVQLGSDGKRGYPLAAAGLETVAVVNAITTVMEGGLKAFELRRSFYARHKSS